MVKYDFSIVDELTAKYGSPLYVFDGFRFKESFFKLEQAMKKVYSNYRIAYSVKTNYTPYVCSLVKECGGMAEVVSHMEYELARSVGFDPADIIFNGPYKHRALTRALLEGATVILDNAEEVKSVAEIAKNNPDSTLHLGIRLNFDINNGKVSRFGFDVESNELRECVMQLKRMENVAIEGVHCHFTGARNLEKWQYRAESMISLCRSLIGGVPRFIDLGSGMYGELEKEFSKQFGADIPAFDDYARVVAGVFNEEFASLSEDERPLLLTEPGTTLVANAWEGIARIEAIKTVRGKSFAILDTSQHILGELSASKNLPIQVLCSSDPETAKHYSNLDFVGYTCLEYDVLYRAYEGEIAVGDYVVFGNIGSYSIDMKPPFILPCCAAVATGDDPEEFFLIKREETFSDVFETYRFDC